MARGAGASARAVALIITTYMRPILPEFDCPTLRMIDGNRARAQPDHRRADLKAGWSRISDAASTLFGQPARCRPHGRHRRFRHGLFEYSLFPSSRCPLDHLKIDSGIVRDITATGRDRAQSSDAIITWRALLGLRRHCRGRGNGNPACRVFRKGRATCYQGFPALPGAATSEALADWPSQRMRLGQRHTLKALGEPSTQEFPNQRIL